MQQVNTFAEAKKEKTPIKLADVLKYVYTAKNCTDVSDLQYNIEEVKRLRLSYPHLEKGLTRRLVSLQLKLKKYEK